MKKNIVIVLLVLLVLGLGVFIVNDKVLKKEEVKEKLNYEEIALSEEFKTLGDLEFDVTNDFEKNYKITLNNEEQKLTIINKYEKGKIPDANEAKIKILLNEKEVFSVTYCPTPMSYGDPDEISGIAIYNGKYLVVKQDGTIGEFETDLNKLTFIDATGKTTVEQSYAINHGMEFDGKDIYYYADKNGGFEKLVSDYWDAGFEPQEVYVWKKVLGEEGKLLKEYNHEIEVEDLITITKEYYKLDSNSKDTNLYIDGEVEYWNINSVKYLGYKENDKNLKYYILEGNYKCSYGNKCVYMEQEIEEPKDEVNKFKTIVAVQYSGSYYIDHIESLSLDVQLDNDPELSSTFVKVNKTLK